ncbi:MAG: hypothetical protein JWS12_141 [Candidatus Saccharibacteria bacterium]|nr:hypothetical protein [Candidatus Saccharibacteria bacterium]
MTKGLETTGESVAPVEAFRAIVEDTLASNGIMSEDRIGNRTFAVGINRYKVAYTAYGPEPKGVGKPILWGIDFTPTHALDISRRESSYLFALRSDDPRVIMRRYKTGALIAQHGLPDLHTSTRPLNDEEAEALLLFAGAPHLHQDKLAMLFRLTDEEIAAKQAKDSEVAQANAQLYNDLARIAQRRRIPPPDDVVV